MMQSIVINRPQVSGTGYAPYKVYEPEYKAEMILKALAIGNVSKAAKELKMPLKTLDNWVRNARKALVNTL